VITTKVVSIPDFIEFVPEVMGKPINAVKHFIDCYNKDLDES